MTPYNNDFLLKMSRKTTRKRKKRVSDDDETYVLSESEREDPLIDANVSTSVGFPCFFFRLILQ